MDARRHNTPDRVQVLEVLEDPRVRGSDLTLSQHADSLSQESSRLHNEAIAEFIVREQSTNFSNYPGVESFYYDYAAERNSSQLTNLPISVLFVIKGCVSTGIMGIHEAYMLGGIWTSLAFTIVLGCLVCYSMQMLVRSAQRMYQVLRVPSLTYPELIEAAVAIGPMKSMRRHRKIFRFIADVILLASLCSTCSMYQVIMSESLKKLIQFTEIVSENMAKKNMSIRLYILIISVYLLALCMIRQLKYISRCSFLADIFLGVTIIATLSYGISKATEFSKLSSWKNEKGFFVMLAATLFSLEGVAVSLPIENHMKSPKYFRLVLQFAIPVVMVCIALVGFFGYWVFGENCVSPITLHLPEEGWFPISLQISLVFVLSTIFAVHFYIAFRLIWHHISKLHRRHSGRWERFYRFLLLIPITAYALIFPNILLIMNSIGASILVFVVFVFPPIIEIIVFWKDKRKKWFRDIKNIVFIFIGMAIMIGHLST